MTAAESLGSLSIETYLERLASGEPAPGGGAAVAVTGAQAAALLAMTLHVTGEKTPLPEARHRLLDPLDGLRRRFVELADADKVAFGAVMTAYRLPQDTDAAKTERKAQIQAALKGATEVPLEVMARLGDLFEIAEEAVAAAKPSVISDAAIAVHLLAAALKAATYNVTINLKHLRDEDFKARSAATVKELMKGRKKQRKGLLAAIQKQL